MMEFDPAIEKFSPEAFGSHLRYLIEEVRQREKKERVLFLCIGSDRCTGDSLGPLIGHKLNQQPTREWEVLGTLHEPVHALNLRETADCIRRQYAGYVVVTIDASLGQNRQVGRITMGRGAIRPGQGLQKELVSVGDVYITGVVGACGREPWILQNTRLSLVMDMADAICTGICRADRVGLISKEMA
ncbi:MAG: spore protease YyaC [Lachnospiraceae bacterium]|nr:spore protease YyaC [Lachnospiraceae bacterium]